VKKNDSFHVLITTHTDVALAIMRKTSTNTGPLVT
jgi:hypothetical protein